MKWSNIKVVGNCFINPSRELEGLGVPEHLLLSPPLPPPLWREGCIVRPKVRKRRLQPSGGAGSISARRG